MLSVGVPMGTFVLSDVAVPRVGVQMQVRTMVREGESPGNQGGVVGSGVELGDRASNPRSATKLPRGSHFFSASPPSTRGVARTKSRQVGCPELLGERAAWRCEHELLKSPLLDSLFLD